MYLGGGLGGSTTFFETFPDEGASISLCCGFGRRGNTSSVRQTCVCVFVYHKKAPICVCLCVTVCPVQAPSSCVSTANSFFSSGRFVSHTRIPFAYGTWILYFLLWARPLCITVNLTTSNIGRFKYQNIPKYSNIGRCLQSLYFAASSVSLLERNRAVRTGDNHFISWKLCFLESVKQRILPY